MPSKKNYTIYLKKASHKHAHNTSLQNILSNLKDTIPNAKNWVVKSDLIGEETRILRIESFQNGIYVVYCVVDPDNPPGFLQDENIDSINITPIANENNKKYPNKASAIYINNDYLLSIGNNTNIITSIIKQLCEKNEIFSNDILDFTITNVALDNPINEINKFGVKKIHFPLTAILNNVSETSEIKDLLCAFIGNEEREDTNIAEISSMSGHIFLNKGKLEKNSTINEIAKGVTDHDDINSYSIELENGATITHNELVASKKIKLPSKTNISFCHLQAKLELLSFWSELKQTGRI